MSSKYKKKFITEVELHSLFNFRNIRETLDEIYESIYFNLSGEIIGYFSQGNLNISQSEFEKNELIGLVTGYAKPIHIYIEDETGNLIQSPHNLSPEKLHTLINKGGGEYYIELDVSHCSVSGTENGFTSILINRKNYGQLVLSLDLYSDSELLNKNIKIPDKTTFDFRLTTLNPSQIPEVQKYFYCDNIMPFADKLGIRNKLICLLCEIDDSILNQCRIIGEIMYENIIIQKSDDEFINLPFAIKLAVARADPDNELHDNELVRTAIKYIGVLQDNVRNNNIAAIDKHTRINLINSDEIESDDVLYWLEEVIFEKKKFEQWLDTILPKKRTNKQTEQKKNKSKPHKKREIVLKNYLDSNKIPTGACVKKEQYGSLDKPTLWYELQKFDKSKNPHSTLFSSSSTNTRDGFFRDQTLCHFDLNK